MKIAWIIFWLLPGCSSMYQHENFRTMDSELLRLQQTVVELQGTLTMLTNFVAGDFSECSQDLPPFEAKICKIAQTANADQLLIINGQLGGMIKKMQDSLYGTDCSSEVDAGCPIPGSITSMLDSMEEGLVNLEEAISVLEDDIVGMQSDLAAMDIRLQQLEDALAGSDYFSWIFLCNGTTTPNEPVLIRGDRLELRGYVSTTTNNGLGQIASANFSGHQFLQTNVSPKCNFRVYDLVSQLKVCWKHGERTATSGAIDSVCDLAGNFVGAGPACVCK